MARRRPHRDQHVPLRTAAFTRIESDPGGDWYVRSVSGAAAAKDYRCPGCDQVIVPGTAHVVVWPAEDHGSLADRRHWHSACWEARHRRRPGRR